MSTKKSSKDRGNFISEWFGHRVYPIVNAANHALADQASKACPFLSVAKGIKQECIKKDAAQGLCTISSVSNAARRDWLACPYRALSTELLDASTRRLFGVDADGVIFIVPAVRLADAEIKELVRERLGGGERVFIYFDAKLGGELSIPSTERSPEFSFDVTIFEIYAVGATPHIGRFGVLEIQTMDFHGSYKSAVTNLNDALRLHGATFPAELQRNQHWLSDKVEGPNIANVFKRTFYQMMFKFQLATDERCAGCALAIAASVWDSWQRHLAAPALTPAPDGTFTLFKPGTTSSGHIPAWVLVFDTDVSAPQTPSPLTFSKVIATDAPSISYYALEQAPAAALENIYNADGLFGLMVRRVYKVWPELAATVRL
ncbi:MAG: hypothetical protein K2P94_04075 [Rhodospirillaceae bacterium]|nr:hypothetical protein [Rhodospirillaceae bacterium]